MQFHAPHFRHPNRNGRVLASKRVCAVQIDNALEVVDWCYKYYFGSPPDSYGMKQMSDSYISLRHWEMRLRRLCPRTRWPVNRMER